MSDRGMVNRVDKNSMILWGSGSSSEEDRQLCEIIDKYLSEDEQKIAESLGALFYQRSLELYDKRKMLPYDQLTREDKADGSRYGTDYYKYLGYRLLVQAKKLTHDANVGKGGNDIFNWAEMLQILYGKEARRCVDNPFAYCYDHFAN